MADTIHHLAPPGRVVGAPVALTCVWTFDANGRLFGRWIHPSGTPQRPARRASLVCNPEHGPAGLARAA